MKKLIIALAAVAMATGVQAASMNWGGTTVASKQDGQSYAGYTNVGAIYQLYALSADITDTSKFSFDGTTLTVDGATATLKDSVEIDSTLWTKGQFASEIEGTAAELNKAYAVVVYDASVNDKIYSVETFKMTAVTDDGGAKKVDFIKGGDASMLSGSAVAQNWQDVAAVPEPTSGLLLLLGVAGLALKRRRA